MYLRTAKLLYSISGKVRSSIGQDTRFSFLKDEFDSRTDYTWSVTKARNHNMNRGRSAKVVLAVNSFLGAGNSLSDSGYGRKRASAGYSNF